MTYANKGDIYIPMHSVRQSHLQLPSKQDSRNKKKEKDSESFSSDERGHATIAGLTKQAYLSQLSRHSPGFSFPPRREVALTTTSIQ